MTTTRLYISNIASCTGAICVCAVLAYLVSFAVGFVFYHDALTFRLNGGAIETRRLEQFDTMQRTVVVIGCAVGLAVSQAVFLVKHLRLGR